MADANKPFRTFTIDSLPVNTDDAGHAILEKHNAAVTTMKTQLQATVKIGDQQIPVSDPTRIQTAYDAVAKELADTKPKVLTDAQIEERVASRVKTIGDATALVKDYKPEGKTNVAIQREVITHVIGKDASAKPIVDAVLGGKSLEAADEATVGVAFNTLVATGKGKVQANDSAQRFASAVTQQSGQSQQHRTSTGDSNGAPKLHGRAAMIARQENAWEPKK